MSEAMIAPTIPSMMPQIIPQLMTVQTAPVALALAAWAPLITLLGALVCGVIGNKIKEPWAGVLASATVGTAFVLVSIAALRLASIDGSAAGVHVPLWSFFDLAATDGLPGLSGLVTLPHLSLGFVLDSLSLTMMLVITGVGFLIHIFSLGYMHNDVNIGRYFAYLNLFVTAMLILVLADSYLLMFVGWEGVGVCSYLLIGFWYQHTPNADAARKAFIVNRVGDVGFLLAMFTCALGFGTLNIADISQQAVALGMGSSLLTAVGLLFFIAATGKSAQLPLHVWLPDAMAGPTPVSALIHAATMVTAGVYLIARSSAIYAHTPAASAVVAWVGALTAVIAAITALSQQDIKKILAYSTISQLGYMFVGVGVGAYAAGMFHVLTHAFFKALLFLAAGAVIHALHGEQNVANMGGLRKYLPITHITALTAVLAISGVPLLSGFFSKDAILSATFNSTLIAGYGQHFIYLLLLGGAVLTAFYMFRWYYLVFGGTERFDPEMRSNLHVPGVTMRLPLLVLAFFSAVVGYVGLPEFIANNRFALWLAPVLMQPHHAMHPPVALEWILMSLSITASLGGLGYAYWVYHVKDGAPAQAFSKNVAWLNQLSQEAFGFDETYAFLFKTPLTWLANIAAMVDRYVWTPGVQGLFSGLGSVAKLMGRYQTGFVRAYALAMLSGVALLLVLVWVAGGGQ